MGSGVSALHRGEDQSAALGAALVRLAELERERRVADALVQVAEQAGETIDLTLLLDRICRLTVELVPADRATVYLYNSRLQAYVPFADCGSPARVFERFAGKPFFPQSRAGAHRRGVPFRDELVAHGIAHHSRDHEPTPEATELLDELEAYATCQVPLRGSRGSLNVYLERPPDFDETALRIIRGVARQADNLIQHSRLFKKTHDASRLRAGLAGLAAAVNLETDPVRIARLVCAEACSLFRVDVAAVLVPDGDGVVVLGSHGVSAEGLRVAPGEDAALLVPALRDGTIVFQNQLAHGPTAGTLPRGLGLRSALVLPLMGADGTMGCLVLGNSSRRYGFSQEIADEAAVLGPITSAALARVALFGRVERSEEHFRSLIEHASDLIAILGPDGVFRYQSPSSERIIGRLPEELVGRRMGDFVHPDDAARLTQLFAELLDGHAVRRPTEARFRHADGSWRVLEGVGTRVLDATGNPSVIINSRDVTRRKRFEAREAGHKRVLELLARAATLDEVLGALVATIEDDLPGATAAALVVADGTLRVAAAPHLPGALRRRLDGFTLEADASGAGAAAACRARVVRAEPGGAGVDDRTCWTQPILAAHGEVLGVLLLYGATPQGPEAEELGLVEAAAHLAGIAIERRRAERAVAVARDDALTAARLKSEFVANVSHEIRTPMNCIFGMTEMLDDTSLAPEQRRFVDSIRGSAEALLVVINDVLDLSKIEAGKMTVERVPFDLGAVMEEIADLLAPRAFARRIELACLVPPSLPRALLGDPHRLRQVLTNLVGNAIKFTETGSVSLEAEVVAATATDARIRLVVRDTGIGIPKERQQLIFESFTQADGSTTRRYGGTGLGLAISLQLVELMGGRIALESAPGRGSTFIVDLTVERTAEAAPRTETAAALAGVRLLVVDDVGVARRAVAETLRSAGCVVEEAASGAEGMARLGAAAEAPIRLVLLDATLPDGATETTAHAIRVLHQVPVVLLSPLGVSTATTKEFAAWIAKPVRRRQLLETVSALLDRP